jgi:hypothetical protein
MCRDFLSSNSSLQPHASHPPTLSSSQAWQLNMCNSPPHCSLMFPTHPLCPHPRPGSLLCTKISCLVFSTSSLQPHASYPPILSSSQAWLVILCRDILSFPPPPCNLMLPTHPLCPHPMPVSSISAEISCLFHLLPAPSCFPPTHYVHISSLAAPYVQRFPVFSTSSLQPHVSHPPTLSTSQAWQLTMCRDFLSFPPPPCSLMLPIHPSCPHHRPGSSVCAEISCPSHQWWANLDQASKDLDKTIFRDLSPTPIP